MSEGGADFVISKFSLDQVLRNPTALLDALTLYLFIVHNIDWYSSNWGRTSTLTNKEQSELKVFEETDIDHDEQVSKVIEDLRLRTEKFVHKVQKFIRWGQKLYTGRNFTQLHLPQEPEDPDSRISIDHQ